MVDTRRSESHCPTPNVYCSPCTGLSHHTEEEEEAGISTWKRSSENLAGMEVEKVKLERRQRLSKCGKKAAKPILETTQEESGWKRRREGLGG